MEEALGLSCDITDDDDDDDGYAYAVIFGTGESEA